MLDLILTILLGILQGFLETQFFAFLEALLTGAGAA
ncbi:MAG: hypothetical protein CHACPFDD_01093 [Phycisphaerae bacterium]|nr:hypothetical protein [Phycisphaerae bacterium]